ncbi:hypothetical protein BDZ91DRAFT_412271 [Kalaharituber pfeilii]|nr:hypothetical protein BDZ91DRAFT_412271 [Kalaharituber pfeilii]
MDSMAQTRVPAQQQRDPDLTGSDEFLTNEKLDSLWEWFCNVGNEDKFHSQLIFAKLVNSARKPYRDNLSLSQHRDRLFTPDASRYASSEYTVTSGYIEEQQHPEQSEDNVTMEALSTKLAIAEDSAQTKQTIIKYLEDSLQMKQTIINQLEARIKGMERVMKEIELRHESQKKQLQVELKKVQQEYLEYKEKKEGEKMQLESKLTEMDQMLQEYKQKVEGEKKQLELDLKEVRQEYLEYKEKGEGERMQLELKLKEMDQTQQDYKRTVEGLQSSLQQLEVQHKKCGRFVVKSELHNTFIAVKISFFRFPTLKASTTFTGSTTFTLANHPNGMVSFRTPSLRYLSVNDYPGQNERAAAVTLDLLTCGRKEMFCLHEDDSGGRYIESAAFPGNFLSACSGDPYIVLREGKSAAAIFYFIAR